MTYENRLSELGIEMPEAPSPLGSYVPCVQAGDLLFLSGILPIKNKKLIYTGRAGKELTLKEAQTSSRQVVINALAVIKSFKGSLESIVRCVKLNGYVASADSFHDQPLVINAASDLLYDIFGEAGRHARSALGVNSLPMNAPVEIDFIFGVKPD
ncbi:endoribonuclease L-PSP [bacterium BMS3Abin07]|nr:endoribonuclease L-PSP [bacterium BMS3Abin07]HDL19727.1 RidA family protein [Nitrospirota bacterium]HDO21970.1 RidA family protein [Nitrospirota bacterium]